MLFPHNLCFNKQRQKSSRRGLGTRNSRTTTATRMAKMLVILSSMKKDKRNVRGWMSVPRSWTTTGSDRSSLGAGFSYLCSPKMAPERKDGKDFWQGALNGWLRARSRTRWLLSTTRIHLPFSMLLFDVFFIGSVCAYVTILPFDSCWVAWPQPVGELMMGSEVFGWEARSPAQQCFAGWKMAACWTFIHYKWCAGDLYKRHCQPVTENLYYSIRRLTPPSYQSGTSYLAKSSVAAAASNIWGITTWRWTDQWSMWVRAHLLSVDVPSRRSFAALTSAVHLSHRSSCA